MVDGNGLMSPFVGSAGHQMRNMLESFQTLCYNWTISKTGRGGSGLRDQIFHSKS